MCSMREKERHLINFWIVWFEVWLLWTQKVQFERLEYSFEVNERKSRRRKKNWGRNTIEVLSLKFASECIRQWRAQISKRKKENKRRSSRRRKSRIIKHKWQQWQQRTVAIRSSHPQWKCSTTRANIKWEKLLQIDSVFRKDAYLMCHILFWLFVTNWKSIREKESTITNDEEKKPYTLEHSPPAAHQPAEMRPHKSWASRIFSTIWASTFAVHMNSGTQHRTF